jgi:hypothetical protein
VDVQKSMHERNDLIDLWNHYVTAPFLQGIVHEGASVKADSAPNIIVYAILLSSARFFGRGKTTLVSCESNTIILSLARCLDPP